MQVIHFAMLAIIQIIYSNCNQAKNDVQVNLKLRENISSNRTKMKD